MEGGAAPGRGIILLREIRKIIHYQVESILWKENLWTLFIIKWKVFYGKEIHEHYSLSGRKYSMERKFMNIFHYQVVSILWRDTRKVIQYQVSIILRRGYSWELFIPIRKHFTEGKSKIIHYQVEIILLREIRKIIHYQVGRILWKENSWTLFNIKWKVFYGEKIR